MFDCLKQSYLHTAATLTKLATNAGELTERDRRKVEFHTRLFLEALSPSNYFATNPEVLRATFEQKGANLVRGMKNIVEDFDSDSGQLMIRQTDKTKFKVGENMAVTEGQVIYRNSIMELIQYTPKTAEVHKTPVLICPPWINKYYILDLNPKKSLVKWLVEQGHTVFMISWVNPDQRHADKEFVDYVAEGLFEALARTLEETGAEQAHVTSYCIGGTMTATALAYLAAQPDHPLADKVASATFLTTQVEFSNAGELQLFVDDEQIDYIKEQMRQGTLAAQKMAASFNLLRSADLIWAFVVSNYLLGKEPFPFDLLYWNSDSTSMPARVHTYYLKKFYRDDALAMGELTLGGVPLDLTKIEVPSFHVATKEDHIAPASSVYRGFKRFGGDKSYVMAGSGHIAGVVNPPAMQKYQYWMRDDGAVPETVDAWRDGAAEEPGSWWPAWDLWLQEKGSGEMVPARQPGRHFNAMADAPGVYVRVRYDEQAPDYELSDG